MVGNQYSVDDEPIGSGGDQPQIDGPTPTTAQDYVRDSQPKRGTGEETPVPLGDGVIEEDDGWTAAGPSR
ncbi:hypothetical protein [Nocardia jiangsuensis]|uniref:Uncharacterized protein n=1 Tax=Nocardia jiangsuensis TaxID=1691563 RepID=A0ABV8DP92_9NOCA